MNLRRRFLLIILSLVFLGVMAISSYSILFVRDYLLTTSRDNLDRQAHYVATLLASQSDSTQLLSVIDDYARYTGHQVELIDANFRVKLSAGAIADTTAPVFSGIAPMAGPSTAEREYVRITASETEIKRTLARVRYIIYGGIFGALLLSVAVSWVVADRISLPIRRLAGAARRIAGGELVTLPQSNRKDEIGDLTRDVAAMAHRLQEDISDLTRLNKAQEDFIAALSHEVRNPVFAARGYIEMALEELVAMEAGGAAKDQVLAYLEKGHQNLLRLHQLFADMLTLIRLEFDRQPVDLVPVSLAALVKELEEIFLPLAREQETSMTITTEVEKVHAKPEILKIALTNLLSNAIRHTGQGQVTLSITRSTNGQARFQVADTGMGIPAEEMERIFERFYRVDKARSRAQGGTGLGLSLVQQCMRTLGTEIHLSSREGEGATFWFELEEA